MMKKHNWKKATVSLFLATVFLAGAPLAALAAEEPALTEEPFVVGAEETFITEEPLMTEESLTTEESFYMEPEETVLTEDAAMTENTFYVGPEETVFSEDADEENDALFAAYFDSVMKEGTEDALTTVYYAARRAGLAEGERKTYDYLKKLIVDTAAGLRDSTAFAVPIETVLGKRSFTMEELGLPSGATGDQIQNALLERIGDGSKVLRSLMTDLPYEMYWYDKRKGCKYSTPGFSYSSTKVTIVGDIGYPLSVAKAYAVDRKLGTTQVDTSVTGAVASTKQKALDIVNKHISEEDLKKLESYRDEICALTSYNGTADAETDGYGDPWQVIYVLDGDSGTNVVCEGYAKTFQLLCDLSTFQSKRIECFTFTGNAFGGGHMWNGVRMGNGHIYLADVTNSDAGDTGSNKLFLRGSPTGNAQVVTVTRDGSSETETYQYDGLSLQLFSDQERTMSEGESYAKDVENNVPDAGDVPVTSVILDQTQVTLHKGGVYKVIPTVRPSTATDQRVTFSSADGTVATVSVDGTITAKNPGKTTITATTMDGGFKASCDVNVTIPAETITLRESATRSIWYVGESVQLEYEVGPAGAEYGSPVWSCDNEAIGTVSATGLFTAIKAGETKVRVRISSGPYTLESVMDMTVRDAVEGGLRATDPPELHISEKNLAWEDRGGFSFWYENGVRQGTILDANGVQGDGTIRGREIYDEASNAWYWLDAVLEGAKAVNKEVWVPYIFQDEAEWSEEKINGIVDDCNYNPDNIERAEIGEQVKKAILAGKGKWVRYNARGEMIKGWYTVETEEDKNLYPKQAGNTYYYDRMTGLMAKGWTRINGWDYYFDEITGVMAKGWTRINDVNYHFDEKTGVLDAGTGSR